MSGWLTLENVLMNLKGYTKNLKIKIKHHKSWIFIGMITKTLLKLLLVLILTTSCVSTYSIQKNHSKGSYISWHGKHKKKYTKYSLTN